MVVQLINKDTGSVLPCRVIDNEDGTHLVEVIPPQPGTYVTNVTFGGLKVAEAPVVRVSPAVDVSKIKVDGLEESECSFSFFVFWLISYSEHNMLAPWVAICKCVWLIYICSLMSGGWVS